MVDGVARIVEKLLARHRRDWILLHRYYPPHAAPRTNSKFGGLPRLPEHHAWPCTPEGVPLHFLAQIDCADIPFRTQLPPRGVLFFFGRDDAEQYWPDDRPASEYCRVLYAQDAFALTPPRPAPADLPAIGGPYPRPNARPFLRDGEEGPNIHVEWPIEPLRFVAWPDVSALGDTVPTPLFDLRRLHPSRLFESAWESLMRRANEQDAIAKAYEEALDPKRDAEYYRATNVPLPPSEQWNCHSMADKMKLYGKDGAPDAFPSHWAHLDFFCRAAAARASRSVGAPEGSSELGAVAAQWVERARAKPPSDPVSEADRAEFRAWVASLNPPDSTVPLYAYASEWIVEATIAVVRLFAGDPDRAALIPPETYALLAPLFNGHSVWGPQFSQMLGNAPSAQEASPVDDPAICLLNLDSDGGLGWMFGDVGNCSFWISPTDLARRDFSRAWATIAGH